MRLRQIEVFHAVYSSGSISNAARLLNVSQPSVSKVLAHAEQQLGYPLFDRVKGKLVPTPEAGRLFGLAANVFEHVDRLRHVSRNLRAADSGIVRVAATPAFGLNLLPSSVASYLVDNPATEFEVETLHYDEISEALLDARIDIGLVFDPAPTPGLHAESIAEGEFLVVAPGSSGFGKNELLSVKDLERFPFVSLSGRGPLGRLLSSHLDGSGVALKKVVYTETYHVALALVAAGAGVSIIDCITAGSGLFPKVGSWRLKPALTFSVSALLSESLPLSQPARRFLDHVSRDIQRRIAHSLQS